MVETRSGNTLGNVDAPVISVDQSPSSSSEMQAEDGEDGEENLLSPTGATIGSPTTGSISSINPSQNHDLDISDAYPIDTIITPSLLSGSLQQYNLDRRQLETRSPEPGQRDFQSTSRQSITQTPLSPPPNDSTERVIDQLHALTDAEPTGDQHTDRRYVASTTSASVNEVLTEHHRHFASSETVPFHPGRQSVPPQRTYRTSLDCDAIRRSTQDHEVPWSTEGAGNRQKRGALGDSAWVREETAPIDKLSGELNSMLNKRGRESSGSEPEDKRDAEHKRIGKKHRKTRSLPKEYRYNGGNKGKEYGNDKGGRGDRDDSNGGGIGV